MDAYFLYLNDLLNKNKEKFSGFEPINWLNPYQAIDFQFKRDLMTQQHNSSVLFKGTKPYYKHISKGCNICGKGKWSCLFITGKCNANCFYCPSEQNLEGIPSSQGLTFYNPVEYADYINYFNFKGVSFSGGEPLMVSEKVMDYLQAIRKHCDPNIYTWMYTNGILADRKVFKKLAALKLNEVRFDIGATSYSLEKIKMAKGIIDNLSIEIPAIPEHKDEILALLPEMVSAGVKNLNLHQLRLTAYNAPKLLKRNYTYMAAEKPIVIESELTALEIIEHARKEKINIGINYCSFFYKNRFQSNEYIQYAPGYFPSAPPADNKMFKMWFYENIEEGLREY